MEWEVVTMVILITNHFLTLHIPFLLGWNDFAYVQRHPISDPYKWHVNNYMQNYFGDLSFDDYSSQYTYSTHRDDEDSENFEPHRNSMWY